MSSKMIETAFLGDALLTFVQAWLTTYPVDDAATLRLDNDLSGLGGILGVEHLIKSFQGSAIGRHEEKPDDLAA